MKRLFVTLLLALSLPLAAAPKAFMNSDWNIVVDGKKMERNVWKGGFNITNEFKSNSTAQELIEKSNQQGKIGSILNWGALGAFLLYSTSTTANDSYNSTTGSLIFLVPWITGIVYSTKSAKNLTKAINIYNGVPADQALNKHDQNNQQAPLKLAWQFEF